MSRTKRSLSRVLVLIGLSLVLLTSFGAGTHDSAHGTLALDHGATTQSLAGHTEPDLSLHLEAVSETRSLVCPGCLLQTQLGGSHLRNLPAPAPPVISPRLLAGVDVALRARALAQRSSRAPPLG